MRYTECRMAPLAMEMVRDITENTVDFKPNYDGKEQEPVVLPSRFPNLLVNGSTGIAVGMATNIPTHNLREVAAAVQWALEHPEATRRGAARGLDGAGQRARLPQRRPDRRPPGHRGRLPDRPRLGHHARGRRHRGGPRRPYQSGGDRAAAHGQPRQPGAQDRRAGEHRQGHRDRRHPRQHVGADRAAAGDRAEARRPAAGGAEQPLQAHPAAGHLRLQHAGAGRRRAADPAARPVHLLLGDPPDRGHPAPHPAPAGRRRARGPHLPRPGQGARRARRRDRADPGQRQHRRRPPGPDGAAGDRRGAGHGDLGHAAAPAGRAGAAADHRPAGRVRAGDRPTSRTSWPGRSGSGRSSARSWPRSSTSTATTGAPRSSPPTATCPTRT